MSRKSILISYFFGDDMIPLGQLTSQPPLLPHQGKAPTTPEQAADAGGVDVTEVDSAASDGAAAPTPTPTMSAEATTVDTTMPNHGMPDRFVFSNACRKRPSFAAT